MQTAPVFPQYPFFPFCIMIEPLIFQLGMPPRIKTTFPSLLCRYDYVLDNGMWGAMICVIKMAWPFICRFLHLVAWNVDLVVSHLGPWREGNTPLWKKSNRRILVAVQPRWRNAIKWRGLSTSRLFYKREISIFHLIQYDVTNVTFVTVSGLF